MSSTKRLWRVRAFNDRGHVLYTRDYQSRRAAEGRADRLLDDGRVRHADDAWRVWDNPALQVHTVTVQPSEIVRFTAEPRPHRRRT